MLEICLTNCVLEVEHIGLGVFHELQNANKMLHLLRPIQRRVSLDQVVPGTTALEDASRLFVSLSKLQSRLKVEEGQKPLDQLSCLPQPLFCLPFARSVHVLGNGVEDK